MAGVAALECGLPVGASPEYLPPVLLGEEEEEESLTADPSAVAADAALGDARAEAPPGGREGVRFCTPSPDAHIFADASAPPCGAAATVAAASTPGCPAPKFSWRGSSKRRSFALSMVRAAKERWGKVHRVMMGMRT